MAEWLPCSDRLQAVRWPDTDKRVS